MDNVKKELIAEQISDLANNNEDFCKALITAVDAAAVEKILVENGIEVTSDEVKELFNAGVSEMEKYAEAEEGEMTDEEMDQVSGGGFLRGILATAGHAAVGFGFGCLCAAIPAAASATPYVVGGLTVASISAFKKKGW